MEPLTSIPTGTRGTVQASSAKHPANLLPNPFNEKTPPLDSQSIDSCAEHLSDASIRLRLFKLRLGSTKADTAKESLAGIAYELRLIQRLSRQINNLCTAELGPYPQVTPAKQPPAEPSQSHLYRIEADVRRHTT